MSCDEDRTPRRVSFSDINVREFQLTFDTNRKGPVLSLDWKYQDRPVESLSDYEESHQKRRSFSELKLTKTAIKQRLMDNGFTASTIDTRLQKARAIKTSRRKQMKRSNSWDL